jgi:uncharacterized protein YndB with AHSA1/START domain
MMIDTTGTRGPVVGVVSRFRAPRDKVFRTWTDPTLIPKWFMAAPGYLPARAEVTLEALGAWKIVVRPHETDGHSVLEGNFIEVQPGKELTYTWRGNVPGGEYCTLVNARFVDRTDGEGSEVRLTHGVFRTDPDRDAHAQGWTLCLTGLARALGEAVSS